jgi:energy-coupling factor transport system ATP-binding protein
MSYIELNEVSYRYPYTKNKAITGVTCHFDKGKFYGIIGRNGGGKTTLCNIIRGLIPHFYNGELEGEVLIDGTDVRNWNTGELSTKIGYVFQNPFTQISGIRETVFEEIALGLENLGIKKKEIIKKVIAICDQLELNDLMEKNPNNLSGGQKQRVAFASIIAMDCEMLVIDEPTSQLDPQGTEDIFKIIDTLKKSGKTILLVEHKINLIAEYCDEVLVMEKGRIPYNDTAGTVLSNRNVIECGAPLPDVALFGFEMKEAGLKLPKIPITVNEASDIVSKIIEGFHHGN